MADLRTLQPSFNGGIFSPSLHARVDLAKYATGLKNAKNMFVHAHGGISNRAGFRFVGATWQAGVENYKTRLIPFQFNTEQSYLLEFSGSYLRFYKDGARILKNGAIYQIATPYASAYLDDIQYVQEADVMYLVHGLFEVRKLKRLAEDNWQLSFVDFQPSITPPSKPTVTAHVYKGNKEYYVYCVSAISSATGEESLASLPEQVMNDLTILGAKNRISWAAKSGVERYRVYKYDNGVYGYIGGTDGLYLDDENINADVSDTPQKGVNPLTGTGNRPRCVNFIEQRLVFASSLNNPQAIWMSQSASYENFGVSQPAKGSDAVTFRIKAREINEIRSLVSMKGMLVLTSGAQWSVSGGSQADAITPSTLKIENQGYRGASRVPPLLIGNMVVFAQNRGGVVRDFSYSYESDGFVDRDLTIMVRHLFDGAEVKAWGYAQSPHSVIWVVLDNGRLLSCTYMKEHDVWGWCEHESGGQDVNGQAIFEDVCVVGEDAEDVVYVVVKRFVGGGWRRYIERLETRLFTQVEDAFFVDSGLSRDGETAVQEVWGLEHLEGQDVVGLVDGNVVRGLKVVGGKVNG